MVLLHRHPIHRPRSGHHSPPDSHHPLFIVHLINVHLAHHLVDLLLPLLVGSLRYLFLSQRLEKLFAHYLPR